MMAQDVRTGTAPHLLSFWVALLVVPTMAGCSRDGDRVSRQGAVSVPDLPAAASGLELPQVPCRDPSPDGGLEMLVGLDHIGLRRDGGAFIEGARLADGAFVPGGDAHGDAALSIGETCDRVFGAEPDPDHPRELGLWVDRRVPPATLSAILSSVCMRERTSLRVAVHAGNGIAGCVLATSTTRQRRVAKADADRRFEEGNDAARRANPGTEAPPRIRWLDPCVICSKWLHFDLRAVLTRDGLFLFALARPTEGGRADAFLGAFEQIAWREAMLRGRIGRCPFVPAADSGTAGIYVREIAERACNCGGEFGLDIVVDGSVPIEDVVSLWNLALPPQGGHVTLAVVKGPGAGDDAPELARGCAEAMSFENAMSRQKKAVEAGTGFVEADSYGESDGPRAVDRRR